MKRNKLALAILAGFPLTLSVSQFAHAQAAKTPAPEQIEAIEVKGSFLGAGSQSAMKLAVPVRDTPFSVSSYTGSFMKAIETANVADMYNYMTGVKRAGNTGSDLTMRGFTSGVNDRNSIMVDGLPGLAGRFASPPVIGTDHVELVKGPQSVLYGQAQPGGFVNIISKRPKGVTGVELDARVQTYKGGGLKLGDDTGYDLAGDVTGPIDSDGVLLYRVVGQTVDKDTYRTNGFDRSQFLAPTLTWNINDNTSATLRYEYRKSNSSYDLYLAAPLFDTSRVASDIRTRYQEPGDTQVERDGVLVLLANHSFANDITWNFGARSVKHNDDAMGFDDTAFRADNQTLRRRARIQHNERFYDFADTSLNIPFSTGPFKHKVIVGLSGGREISDLDRRQFFDGGNGTASTANNCTAAFIALGQCIDIDLYNPVYGSAGARNLLGNPAFLGTAANLTRRYTISDTVGVYSSDLITLTEQWKLTLGLRGSRDRQEIQDRRPAIAPNQYKTSQKGLPLVGLLYQPTKLWTVYTSYSTSYNPQPASSQDITGANPFIPESAKQYEVGVKGENLMKGNLNVTAALFKIDKKNTLNTFACTAGVAGATVSGTCSVQNGAEQSKGVEVEANFRPMKNWQVTAGYAHTLAKIKASLDPLSVNTQLRNSPKDSANVWSRYDIDAGMVKGLGLGVGLVYTGERVGNTPTTAAPAVIKLPSYATADLGLYYDIGRTAFTLKVTNLFDRRYFESAGFTSQFNIFPGSPRTLALSARTHF